MMHNSNRISHTQWDKNISGRCFSTVHALPMSGWDTEQKELMYGLCGFLYRALLLRVELFAWILELFLNQTREK